MSFAYVGRRVRSLNAALRGLVVLSAESHSRIHAVATVLAVTLGIAASLAALEWCALAFAIGLVWMTEGLNTALEKLADAAVPQQHELVGKAKDVAAGAVLIAAVTALAVAAALFLPRLAAL
jgi:diacylglycerol kinase (ATP)